MFEGFDGHFVPAPADDFDPAVDVVEAEPAIGVEREGLGEILLKRVSCHKIADDFRPVGVGFA